MPQPYYQSEMVSDIASLDGRTAVGLAEAALQRAISGREPVTAGHFHSLLGALVHVAHQVCVCWVRGGRGGQVGCAEVLLCVWRGMVEGLKG